MGRIIMCKSCFLFGHADTPQSILPAIEDAVEKHYSKYGIQHFYVGNRGAFDSLAAKAVRNVKERHPDINLYLLLAYHPAEREPDLWGGYDNSFYPPIEDTPRPFAIVKANQYMTTVADTIICYVKHSGNTRNLLEYAQKRQKKDGMIIENLAENY